MARNLNDYVTFDDDDDDDDDADFRYTYRENIITQFKQG